MPRSGILAGIFLSRVPLTCTSGRGDCSPVFFVGRGLRAACISSYEARKNMRAIKNERKISVPVSYTDFQAQY